VRCLYARTDSSMRKGVCAETPSMSPNNDRDWLDVYRAAAMEFRPEQVTSAH